MPLSTEVLIPKDDSVRIVKALPDKLNLSGEAREYAKRKRKVPFILMLRVVVYGFMRRYFNSPDRIVFRLTEVPDLRVLSSTGLESL